MNTNQPNTPGATKRRVLLVDDHASLREGLAAVINHQADLAVCGQAENPRRALELIAELKPDLTIVDISMPGGSGLELIKDIRRLHPEVRVAVLTIHDESLYAKDAFAAGARAYICKEEPMINVLGAFRQVLQGGTYLRKVGR